VTAAAGMVVSGYSPLKSEISPMPLLRRCADAGATGPAVVIGRGKPLVMRAWAFGAPLDSGVWGIRNHAGGAGGVSRHPDRSPARLRSPRPPDRLRRGYYDMTLARLRAMKPVTASHRLRRPGDRPRPCHPRDARLDFVLTERETIDLGRERVRILFIGDIVGAAAAHRGGTPARTDRDWKLDFVVVNGENAAGGFGITEAIYHDLTGAGADAITLGNHS